MLPYREGTIALSTHRGNLDVPLFLQERKHHLAEAVTASLPGFVVPVEVSKSGKRAEEGLLSAPASVATAAASCCIPRLGLELGFLSAGILVAAWRARSSNRSVGAGRLMLT